MRSTLFTLSALALTGCSTLGLMSADPVATDTEQTATLASTSALTERPVAMPDAFQPARFALRSAGDNSAAPGQVITIQHYVRGLMQEMLVSMQDVAEQTPVAVASFVYLDSDFNQGNLLGNQIAESVMHELHNFGVKVLDYKVTDYIRVTQQGDFVHSRNYEELGGNLPAQYAVGGTLSRHRDGILVNARMVAFDSKAVVASAQSLIPNAVVNALLPSLTVNSMPVIKGAN
jgi:TolB-like protein